MKKNEYIIGVSSHYHDSSACLFKNGELVFACEEEKFTGIKHDSRFPKNVINYIFKYYRLKKSDIDLICFYEDPKLKIERVKDNVKQQFFKNPLYSMTSLLQVYLNNRKLKRELSKYCDNVFYSEHHLSHQYYSFYTSNFEKSTILSIDGVGEKDTLSLGFGDKNGIDYMSMAEYPHSIGLFYSAMTAFLGFKPNEGEYKVMGLAAYGDSTEYIDKVRKLITYKNTKLECDLKMFSWNRSNSDMFTYELSEFLEMEPRTPNSGLEPHHKDLAAAVQKRYEELMFEILNTVYRISDSNNLCLSGGSAYNGLLNGKITKNTSFNNLWIPVAPSDAGSSIGACIHYLVKNNKLKQKVNRSPFLGPNYTGDIKSLLKNKKHFKFKSEDTLYRNVAKSLYNGKVVGWFQGHCEFGARALGNRSILGDPTNHKMKDIMNLAIKKRESFRPFAPMVIREKQFKYFDMDRDIPYMNEIVNVKEEYRSHLPSITHIDGTARVQTVQKYTQIHYLLLEFEKLSGFPILLNTSLNLKDKTMCLTPKDAIEMFEQSGMDMLVINNYVIFK